MDRVSAAAGAARRVAGVAAFLALLLGAARADGSVPEEEAMRLTTTAFDHEAAIPQKYTCEGADVSPPLTWSGAPAGAKSFALIVEDPDAPDPRNPKMTWVHWVLYDIPASATSLAEAMTPRDLPAGTRQGHNDWKRSGWGGPCPPIGRHRYFFRLYALDTVLPDLKAPTAKELRKAMDGHVLATAELIGTYQKGGR